jgi:hypothetical protein
LVGVFGFHVSSVLSKYNGCFKFKVQFFKVVWHAGDCAWTLDCVVVGKVKDGILIKLRDHGHTTVSSCGSDVLAEGISISTAAWLGHGGQQNIV